MRRLLFPVVVATGLVMIGPSVAFADDPSPAASATATPGKKICKVTDTRLDELSGIVATSSGFIVMNDSTTITSHQRIFFLDKTCKVVNAVSYPSTPHDPEDMILSPDGKTLWIADTGDNDVRNVNPSHRPSIALWTMPVSGKSEPVIHRLAYPDGDYHDAEALLLDGKGTPIIVTKEISGTADIYEPTEALKKNNAVGVPMKKVGEITPAATKTAGNPLARLANRVIDGGAVARGGGKVVLRTYTDALEWDVTGGDVLAALKTKPRTTPLPNEPLGEAIAYSPDGKYFYTVSDMNGVHTDPNYILQYTPATTTASTEKAAAAGGGGTSGIKKWFNGLTVNEITLLIGSIGLVGLILVGAGVAGIMRSRKNAPRQPAGGLDGPDPNNPETELIGVGGVQRPTGVHGGGTAYRSGPIPASAGAYGAAPAPAPAGAPGAPGGGPGAQGPQRGTGNYGGAPGGRPQYARPPQGGQQPPQPPRGQQPPRGGQQPPARGQQQPGRPVYGGQPSGGKPGGGQPAGRQPGGNGGASQPGGGQPSGRQPGGNGGAGRAQAPQGQRPQAPGPQGQPQRPQGGGTQGQRPRGPQQGQPQRPPQGGDYGGSGRQQRGDDGYAQFGARPDSRFDNPGYGRR